MTLAIQLLGPPKVLVDGEDQGRPRGAKTWALLALLARHGSPLPRSRVAALLFAEADDPLGALRWTASQLRRLLVVPGTVGGDPIRLQLPDDASIDVDLVLRGLWDEALGLPGLGRPLLEGVDPAASAAYELWLAGERRHLDGAAAALLHEATSALLARDEAEEAVGVARRLVALDPYDENAQVVLVQALATTGDHAAAEEQARACTELFRDELGVEPSPAVVAAARRRPTKVRASPTTLRAQLEAGQAAMSAGAADAGLETLRGVADGAAALGDDVLALETLFALGVGLVHTARGTDEEAVAILHRARELADANHDAATAAAACRELAYVEMLRGRYDRADNWLADARQRGPDDAERGWIELVAGSCLSDVADYGAAEAALSRAVELTAEVGDRRGEAFATTQLSRLHYLRGDLARAGDAAGRAGELVRAEGWTSFAPYPETWAALVELGNQQTAESHEQLEHAWAMSCQIGDVCWQTLSLRGLGLVNLAKGHVDDALGLLQEAPTHCRRLPDAYRWAEAYALETLVGVAVEAGHEQASTWLAQLDALTSRHGFRELHARAQLQHARLGDTDAWDLAAMLSAEIDNPLLARDVADAEPLSAA